MVGFGGAPRCVCKAEAMFGDGESTFCIASSPTRKGYIECTFRQAGKVTSALAGKEEGDTVGFRGPFGNVFPMEQWEGKNLLFIAGGIALPPMRCVIWNALDEREKYRDVTIIYGAKTPTSFTSMNSRNGKNVRTYG